MYYLLWYALTEYTNNDLADLIIKKYAELLYNHLVLSLNIYDPFDAQVYPYALCRTHCIKMCYICMITKICSFKPEYVLISYFHIDRCRLYRCSTCSTSFRFEEWSLDENAIHNIMRRFIIRNDQSLRYSN